MLQHCQVIFSYFIGHIIFPHRIFKFYGGRYFYPPPLICSGLLLHRQDNDLSLIDGVGVFQPVGVALKDGLVRVDHSVPGDNSAYDFRIFVDVSH